MSRIKDAIDKARRERGSGGQPSSDQGQLLSGSQRFLSGEQAIVPRVPNLMDCEKVLIDEAILDKNRIVLHQEIDKQAAAAYKVLRTRVQQRMRANGWQTLGVSGPSANIGKTVTAVNLAMSFALDPTQLVCLVDLDLQKPSVAATLGIEPEKGFTSVVDAEVRLTDAMIRCQFDRLWILPQANSVPNSSELMRSNEAISVLQQIKNAVPQPTIVIFDLPPLIGADNVIALEGHLDTLLMVVAEGRTRREDVKRANELLEHFNTIGNVLNMSYERSPKYSYY